MLIFIAALAAAACTISTPVRCRDTNELIRSSTAQAQVRHFVEGRRGAYLYARVAGTGDQLIEVLGGPPDRPTKVGPYFLFSACRAHSCDEKGALLIDAKGALAGAAILYTGCGAGGAIVCGTSDRRLALFVATPIPSDATVRLQRWGNAAAASNSLTSIAVERVIPSFPTVAIDFDGDGLTDRVELDGSGRSMRLIAYRASAPKRGIVITWVRNPDNFFVEKIAPGTYETACGKGAGRASECLVKSVDLTLTTVTYGTAEASRIAAQWDGQRFIAIPLSD